MTLKVLRYVVFLLVLVGVAPDALAQWQVIVRDTRTRSIRKFLLPSKPWNLPVALGPWRCEVGKELKAGQYLMRQLKCAYLPKRVCVRKRKRMVCGAPAAKGGAPSVHGEASHWTGGEQTSVPVRLKVSGLGGHYFAVTLGWKRVLKAARRRAARPTVGINRRPAPRRSRRPMRWVPSAVESCIVGTFDGWTGETVFRLCNGQIWVQSAYSYHYHYAYRPDVLIYPSGGTYKMKVDGVSDTVEVRRLR